MFNSNKIKFVTAREILDSRGHPTLEAKVILGNGLEAKASVPSGASVGAHEARELRDNDKKRYNGLGVKKACLNVNQRIAGILRGVKVTDQRKIDGLMLHLDGTKNKSKLGANAILAVSLACARAGALVSRMPLFEYLNLVFKLLPLSSVIRPPVPMFNIFNGGKHADTNLDFQEFMIIPVKKVKFSEKVQIGAEVFHALGKVLKSKGYDTDVGNEGGYAPNLRSSVSAVEFILEAVKIAGYQSAKEVSLALDVGASELYNQSSKKYVFKLDGVCLSSDDLIELYIDWLNKYPIISIEDGLAQDDWSGWRQMTKELVSISRSPRIISAKGRSASGWNNKYLNNKLVLVGDDLFATNAQRLKRGVQQKVANAVLIKPNQVGTLSETVDCVKLAQDSNYKVIISHRSGETSDDFIADLAVAVNADYFKAGSLSRGERVVKYNRMMEIEQAVS